MLVAFEGIDGSGKSTLVPLVASRLRKAKLDLVVTAEPTKRKTGRLVRRGLRDRVDPLIQAGLFLADRAAHVVELLPAMMQGKVILTDRYVDSTSAYQAAALDGRVGDALASLRTVQAALFPRPDLVVLLDLAPPDALKRIRHRRYKEPYEQQRFLSRVRANYRKLARWDRARWLVVDARKRPAELADLVARAVARRAARVK